MSSLVSSVASYLPFGRSAPPPPPPEEETPNSVDQNEENNAESNKENSPVTKADEVKESDPSELPSDKKTDQVYDPSQQPGLLWRMSSGVYHGATGAVGMGVGGVKWVAGKSYDAGSAVVGTTKAVVSKVPIPTLKKKDKKE